ncbi:MAG TPA: hypothetical protein VGM23_16765, partial [Armatimonadota bacterium]
MPRPKDLVLPVERITPPGEHFFFGYYDNPAWSGDEQYHLCHRVPFFDRLPGEDDAAELGMIRAADQTYFAFADTTAWNFQQGSMLQWNPDAPNTEVLFNRRSGDRYVGVRLNVFTDQEHQLTQPVAAVSPAGRWAVGLNFSRIFDFRAGYGYAGIPDPHTAVAQPT